MVYVCYLFQRQVWWVRVVLVAVLCCRSDLMLMAWFPGLQSRVWWPDLTALCVKASIFLSGMCVSLYREYTLDATSSKLLVVRSEYLELRWFKMQDFTNLLKSSSLSSGSRRRVSKVCSRGQVYGTETSSYFRTFWTFLTAPQCLAR